MKKNFKIGFKIIIIGNISAGKSTIAKKLAAEFKILYHSIDMSRQRIADGTVAGEYDAYADFLRKLQVKDPGIYEFSGVGVHKYAVRYILQDLNLPFVVIWVKCPPKLCIFRRNQMKKVSKLPYPFPITIEESILYNEKELTKKGALDFWNIPSIAHKIICADNSLQLDPKIRNIDIFQQIILEIISELLEFQAKIIKENKIFDN